MLQETHLDELDVETEALTKAVEGKSDKDHTHEGGGDGETGPHNHNEFTEIQNKQDEQDARLDSIESGDASQIGQYVYNPVPSQDGQVAWDNEKLYFRDRDLGGYAFQAPAPGARFFIRVNDISIVGDISSSTLTDNIAVVTGTWEPALPTPKTGDKVAVNAARSGEGPGANRHRPGRREGQQRSVAASPPGHRRLRECGGRRLVDGHAGGIRRLTNEACDHPVRGRLTCCIPITWVAQLRAAPTTSPGVSS